MPGLSQRSSFVSSLFVGVVGWFGGAAVTDLLVGEPQSAAVLGSVLVAILVAQVSVLRLQFETFGMDTGVPRGIAVGAATGLPGGIVLVGVLPELRPYAWLWLPAAAVMGASVGFYLSYFHRDDRRIEAEQSVGVGAGDYGRDATWWEPFPWGALVFGLVFLPSSPDAAFHAIFLGSTIGVVAAASSHFVIANWSDVRASAAVAAVLGAVLGLGAGWLLSPFPTVLPPMVHGVIAGVVTCGGVLWRGLGHAARERASEAGP